MNSNFHRVLESIMRGVNIVFSPLTSCFGRTRKQKFVDNVRIRRVLRTTTEIATTAPIQHANHVTQRKCYLTTEKADSPQPSWAQRKLLKHSDGIDLKFDIFEYKHYT